jgi:hypothetical protein
VAPSKYRAPYLREARFPEVKTLDQRRLYPPCPGRLIGNGRDRPSPIGQPVLCQPIKSIVTA